MGRVAALRYAGDGRQVAVLDLNQRAIDELASIPGIHGYHCDVTDAQQLAALVEQVEEALGPIERVLNCAAIMPLGKLLEQNVETQAKVMRVNWGGLVNLAQAALPRMLERDRGDFVSFASMGGVIPTLMTGAYSSTKAAVIHYSEVLHHEHLGSNVRFACVCPPLVNTPMLEQGKGSWPKMLQTETPIEPETVIDAVDRALSRGQFLVFPNGPSRLGAVMRRLFPSAIWKHVHRTEGW